MVLQEGMKLPVWGTAGPGESVTVTVGTATAKTTAGPDGKWRVDLAALPTQADPVTMTVTGTNTLTFHDVLVGEVWLCGGQSNMEFALRTAFDAATELPAANDPSLRLFLVAKKTSLTPLADVEGSWQLCTPAMAEKFSAIGYFFGRDLRQKLHRPVGLIGSYWGGTPAQAWTSISALQAEPALDSYVKEYQKNVAAEPATAAAYPAKLAAYKAELAEWQKNGGNDYYAAFKAWLDAVNNTGGKPPPPRPLPRSPLPLPPPTADGGANEPANLFNGMIAPLVPYAIKGAIWYQGESNGGAGHLYRTLFPTMIRDWRNQWGEGDFPFLYVQLAAYQAGAIQNWPFLREAQLLTLSLPNTGMASAVDIGNPNNIHPQDKKDVAARLALLARHLAYGETRLPDLGPIYQTMKVSGNKIDLTFTQTAGGLIVGKAPWVVPGLPPIPTTRLVGFSIAAADQKWVPADARIQGNVVVASSPRVPVPVAVRYDWANAPRGNLYNKANLPASPFRTDDWPSPAEGLVPGAVAGAAK
jgi:sialate O-acetylesterase